MHIITLGASLATLVGSAPPENTAPAEAVIEVPAVVITGARRPSAALEVPQAIDAVGAKFIEERQATTAADALDAAPGVFMQRTNAGSGAPIIRGLIGPQNLYLLDGVRVSNSLFRTGPNQYVNLLDPTAIDRFEVLRGPSSVLYGNGAMGGVVHALTEEPGDGSWAARTRVRAHTAAVGGGGDVTVTSRFWGDEAGQQGGFVPSFALLAAGGFDAGGDVRVGGGEEVPISALDTAGWRLKLIWQPVEHHELRAAYFGSILNNAGRADDLGKGDLRVYDNTDHLTYLRYAWTDDAGHDGVRRVNATFSYQRFNEDVLRTTCAITDVGSSKVVADRALCAALDDGAITKRTSLLDTVDTFGGDVGLDLAFLDDRLLVKVGAEVYADQVGSGQSESKKGDDGVFSDYKDKPRGNFSDGSSYLSVGAYTDVEGVAWRFGPGFELRAGGGVRVSHFRASAPGVPDLGDLDYDFTGVVGSAHLAVVLPKTMQVYASFMQGFRAPNLQETTVLGDTGSRFEIPNPDLEPERSDTVELGAKFERSGVTVSLAWYYSLIDQLITDEATTYLGAETAGDANKPVSWRVNADTGHIQGLELAVSAKLWQLIGAFTLTYTTGDVTLATGETVPFRRLPPVFGSASLRYVLPSAAAYLELGLDFAGPQDELNPADKKDARICQTAPYSGLLDPNCDGTPGWAVLNVRAGFRLSPRTRAEFALTNLLDANYRRHGSGYDGAGIDARLQVTMDF